MSTKIYEGWRIKVTEFNDLIDSLKPQVYSIGEKCIEKLMSAVLKEGIEREMKEHKYYSEDWARFEIAYKNAIVISKSNHRFPGIDPNFGLNLWLLDGYFYIIPISENTRDITLPSFVEDYSYWNNADQPEGITDSEWNERGENWNKIFNGYNYNLYRLWHPFIDLTEQNGDISFYCHMLTKVQSNKK